MLSSPERATPVPEALIRLERQCIGSPPPPSPRPLIRPTIAIDEAVREGDLIAGALRVIHLPGKSAGEIGLYFDPAHHAVSREMGGILLLGDAIIGNPPGALSLIPEPQTR